MHLEHSAQGYVAVGDKALVGDNVAHVDLADSTTVHNMALYNDAGEETGVNVIAHSSSIVWMLQSDDPTVEWK